MKHKVHFKPKIGILALKQRAFTLMELVMVMLILAILAIAAAPRFISVQEGAYKTVRENLIQDIDSALDMGAVKAALENMQQGVLQPGTTKHGINKRHSMKEQ